MSDNDPFRGLDDDGTSNKRDWEDIVGARVIFRPGKGHFNCKRLDAKDILMIEIFLGLIDIDMNDQVDEDQKREERREVMIYKARL